MDKKKIVKIVTIVGVIAIALFLVWKLIAYPLIDFYKKEKELTEAGKEYFERNSNLQPNEGEISTVTLTTLAKQKYVESIRITNGKKACDYDNSWVKVKKEEGKYVYITNLVCGNMKSTVDNEGPVIKLKGKEEIEIEKGTKYVDEGIESVYDNTDGKMKIEDVIVTEKVDTNTIGTYKVKYEAIDLLENKTTVERIVKVVQTLNKTIKQNTEKDNTYKGKNPDNYIEFSNMLFRIVGINDDGSVKIVSSEPIGVVNYSDINTWLNEYFYDHLTEKSKKYIVEEDFCSSKVEEKDMKTTKKCETKTKQKVGLLSIKDYNSGEKDSENYLYPNNLAWTSDYNSKSEAWITSQRLTNDQLELVNYKVMNNQYNFAVYPVVNLKKNVKLQKGDGTIENPYIFAKVASAKAGDLVNTRYSGEYVFYGGTDYRIIESDKNGNAKVISVGTVGDLESQYSNKNGALYNPTEKGNIGYYIENKVSSVVKTDIFIKKEIEVPIYKNIASYSGEKTTKKYKVKLSAPNMYEMFSGATGTHNQSYWLINSSKNEDVNYLVSNTDCMYYTPVSKLYEASVRITGYINKKTTILSGNGTKNKPYILDK